ncbi:carboxyl transferase domain-containing protein [Corynebacterium uterequi]|uniref:Acetyl-CoA carboxylase, carboxyltransferase component (Subunits alpha and beta) n=1 Tax=Corynebacterium uterequi TaxID=1072256 RepID=A0A0G3HCR4_9CORY|nr:carboxyl transferase domain-containing protein [Corynebacterium uterequi]AKK10505.1 acetyl-CoA carboxylase, carboxyltransferase component (subunits alpha and beta) [Corynebacterium uterequi]
MTAAPDPATTAGKLADLRARLAEAAAPLGEQAIADAHAAGRRTARERVVELLDDASFVETDALARHRVTDFKLDRTRPATDGVVTGYGTIDGRRVCVYSHDDTIFDGAVGEVTADKIAKVYELAAKTGVPLISVHAGTGTRAVEGLAALTAYGRLLRAATEASGLVPQIALIAGDTTGLAALAPQLADVVIRVDNTAADALTADLHCRTDAEGIDLARRLVGYLPVNNLAEAPRPDDPAGPTPEAQAALNAVLPDDPAGTYDVTDVLAGIVDAASLLELRAEGHRLRTFLARIAGRAVGVIASDGAHLTAAGMTNAARFLRFCDSFNIPLVFVVDSPGVADPGHGRAVAQLAFALADATVGTLSLVTRSALGPAFLALGSKALGADFAFAWPTAQIAAHDADTAAALLPVTAADWAAEHLTAYVAAETGVVDAVIEPAHTRDHLAEALRLLDRKVVATRPKKHGNLPL